jgi:WD40 repeat protein
MSIKVFLSYARGDDESFVWRLFVGLQSAGFTVWFDRVSMPSRLLTFHQEIRDAITDCDRLVFVVGPKAVASDYVSQEWRFAYFEAMKCVNPIIRLGGYDLMPEDLRLFQAEDFQDDAKFDHHLANLVRQLSEGLPQAGALVGVPELPAHFIAQPSRLKDLRDLLLADLRKPVVVTGAAARVGLRGMGGIGKSVIANALVRHPEVRRAFPDGVYWLTLGQNPPVVELQRKLAGELGDPATFTTAEEGEEKLRTLFATRAALLVLDDAWKRPPVERFTTLGTRGRLLLTTRDASLLMALVAPENAYQVKLPEQDVALRLLAKAADLADCDLPSTAYAVVEQCGRLPLALALSGGMARAATSWEDLREALREHDLEWLADPHPAEEQHINIWRTMDASVRVLPEDERQRFTELAVFGPAGAPEAAIETLWQHTGGLSPRHARGLLTRLAARSLIILTSESHRLTLHGLLRSFATGMATKCFGSESTLHAKLLEAYEPKCPDGWPSGPNDGYYFEHLPDHLDAAGRNDALRRLLLNFPWLSNKLDATNIVALLADFNRSGLDEEARLVGGALRLSAGALFVDRSQLAAQLLGRLMACTAPGIASLLSGAADSLKPNMLRPVIPSLTPPGGGLLRTLSTVDDSILSVAITPDGSRVVAGSHFGMVRLWDLETGSLLYKVQGHRARIRSVAITPDGNYAVSAAEDGSIKIWNLEDGTEGCSLIGHQESATAVAVFPDSTRIISCSVDRTVVIWDLVTGIELQRLTYAEGINSLVLNPAGDAVITGHFDGTLLYRDLKSGAIVWTARGHRRTLRDVHGNSWESDLGAEVPALTVTRDGTRVVSGGCEGKVQVWDIATGHCIHTLPGHQHFVMGLGVTPDSAWAVSCSLDKVVCIWDLAAGKPLRLLRGHTEGVWSLAAHPKERRAISGGDDRTVRVWDLESGPQLPQPRGHQNSARCLAAMANARYVLSGSADGTVKKWDAESGAELATFKGHGSAVWAIASSSTGRRVIAGYEDGYWTAWDAEQERLLGSIKAHDNPISSLAVTPDGRMMVAGSYDASLSVWNLDTGEKVRELVGHYGKVMATAITPDGKWALSGSEDRTVGLWDLATGEEIRVFGGHMDWVMAVAISSKCKRGISAGFDGTIRLWNLETETPLHVFRSRAGAVTTVAVTSDFRRGVSGSEGPWLELWDLENFKSLATFSGDAEFRGTVISPDGTRIIAGDQLGRMHILQFQA